MFTLNKLFIPPKTNKSGLICFISQKSKSQINALGKLFTLIELTLPSSFQISKDFCQKTVNLIAKLVETEYYFTDVQDEWQNKTPQRFAEEDLLDRPEAPDRLESLFENALQKTNQRLQMEFYQGFLSKTKAPKDWVKSLNLIIGLIKDKQVIFTQLGSSQAFLLRSSKIINILEKTPKQKGGSQASVRGEKINPLKLFSHITSGQMENNDILLFSTENLLDYFSLEKLKKTLLSYPPQKAIFLLEEKFKPPLSSPQTGLAAIILKIPLSPLIITPKSISKDSDSMKELVKKERKTAGFLHPVLGINILKKLLSAITSSFSLLRRKRPPRFQAKQKIRTEDQVSSPLNSITKRIWHKIRHNFIRRFLSWINAFWSNKIFSPLQNILQHRFFGWRGKAPVEPQDVVIVGQKTRFEILKQIPKEFKQLSKSNKVIFISTLILGFLFIQTIFFLVKQQEKNLAQKTYQKELVQIENLWQSIETSLLYNNKEKAKKLLKTAGESINQLPQKTEAQKEKFITLKELYKNKLNKLWHFDVIEEPVVAVDFNHLKNVLEIKGIVYRGPDIFAWGDKKTENITPNFRRDILARSDILFVSSEIIPEAGPLKFLEILDDNSLLLYYLPRYHPKEGKSDKESRPTLAKFNLAKKEAIPLSFDSKNLGENPRDMALYHRWLYFLDPEKNQIFKYNMSSGTTGLSGFSREQAWLKDPQINLQNAVSLAIDGAIWILQSSQIDKAPDQPRQSYRDYIIKLYAGKQTDFSLEDFEPKLEGPTKIYAHPIIDSLYILDPPSKRIIIFDKTGQVKNQYFSEKFDDLRDFVVDKDKGKIFLLNGNVVYEIL